MKTETAPTYVIRLYLSGPIEVAKQTLRAECLREGLCVTVEPTHFIYTGGEEAGYVVGLVNYPRFPASPETLTHRARELMCKLLEATHQHSALMVTPDLSEWVTKREAAPATAPEWDDGDRFRWLTEDHADPDERAARDRIIASLPGRSCSGARIDIDANVAEFTRKAMLAAAHKWVLDESSGSVRTPLQNSPA